MKCPLRAGDTFELIAPAAGGVRYTVKEINFDTEIIWAGNAVGTWRWRFDGSYDGDATATINFTNVWRGDREIDVSRGDPDGESLFETSDFLTWEGAE